MPPWPHGQQLASQMYDRYGGYAMSASGYPNATASGSPMNYGAYYPPTTYAPSPAYNVPSTGPSYRGGYPAAASYGNSQSNTSTAGPSYGQYATAGSGYTTSGAGFSGPATGNNSYSNSPYSSGAAASSNYGTSGGYGNGHTATSGASYNASYDPAFLTAMHNMSFGSK